MTQILHDLGFNKGPSYFMHIDLNSCFATIEQQANPLLRRRPIAVAAYATPKGCIIAPSVEAKKLGIKVGTRVLEAKKTCPEIVILEPDAPKYRYIHHKLKILLSDYTNRFHAKSVDEFVLCFAGASKYNDDLLSAGTEIKKRIREEIGDYITVSIGISKNQFLAKTASNLKKPDGLEEINENNFLEVYRKLELTQLTGIAEKTATRLNQGGIFNVLDLYGTPAIKLRYILGSIHGYYWYLKLRGYEIEEYEHTRRSFSHQYALPKPLRKSQDLAPIITKLVEKLGLRMRNEGYEAGGVFLHMLYDDYTDWGRGINTERTLVDSRDIYKEIMGLFHKSPQKNIKIVSVGCSHLKRRGLRQLELFENTIQKHTLTSMLDKINNRWGAFVISPASILSKNAYVHDRIGFGNI